MSRLHLKLSMAQFSKEWVDALSAITLCLFFILTNLFLLKVPDILICIVMNLLIDYVLIPFTDKGMERASNRKGTKQRFTAYRWRRISSIRSVWRRVFQWGGKTVHFYFSHVQFNISWIRIYFQWIDYSS